MKIRIEAKNVKKKNPTNFVLCSLSLKRRVNAKITLLD